MVNAVLEHYGKIDILVNNAGLGLAEPAESQSDGIGIMINTNLNGVYYFAREVGRSMKEKGYGRIINIGSIHSSVAMPFTPLTAYNTTKGAVAILTKSLANEWAKTGITVNAIDQLTLPVKTQDALAGEGFQKVVEAIVRWEDQDARA